MYRYSTEFLQSSKVSRVFDSDIFKLGPHFYDSIANTVSLTDRQTDRHVIMLPTDMNNSQTLQTNMNELNSCPH